MKKTAMILSALLFAGVLTACGSKGESSSADSNPADNIPSTEAPEETGTPSADVEENNNTETAYLKDITVEDYMTLEGEYMGLTLYIPARAEVTDEEVEQLALTVYNSAMPAEAGIVDRAVVVGDTINLDYSGKKDGVAFAGGTAQNQQLTIGSGRFIDGFEDGLVGVMPGETVDLNLTFPDYYDNSELAGQEVVFTVTVNYIHLTSASDMQDEVLADLTGGEYESVDTFLEYCREYLEYEADYDYMIAKEDAVIAALDGVFSFSDVPETLQNRYKENIRISLENEAWQYGLDIDIYCYYFYQVDAATYLDYASEISAQQSMMFQFIANREGLGISEEELDESLQRFAEENGVGSVDELLLTGDKENFREYFLFEKVVDFIIENGYVTEV
ncbi:MAG: FKBP-type peptidyl-prolyl cis-trans isomerase [Lachnospiraceae bacterium]|nr:FKBP-type peptidyl-prolyl cis-trans isomerase [Lachnospiraceae bacterium]